jgi:hypothetical protein
MPVAQFVDLPFGNCEVFILMRDIKWKRYSTEVLLAWSRMRKALLFEEAKVKCRRHTIYWVKLVATESLACPRKGEGGKGLYFGAASY